MINTQSAVTPDYERSAYMKKFTFNKVYGAYDLSTIFDFDEAYEFLYVFEDEDEGESSNQYYFFYKAGEIFEFEKSASRLEKGLPVSDVFIEEMEKILQRHHVQYRITTFFKSREEHFFWINDNGYMLRRFPKLHPSVQRWTCGFAPGFKTVGGKYQLNKIECIDAEISYEGNAQMNLAEMTEENRNLLLTSYTVELAEMFLAENADQDLNSYIELLNFVKTHFQEVKVHGAEDSYLVMMRPSKQTDQSDSTKLYMRFKEEITRDVFRRKTYSFVWETFEDVKLGLVGYIRADTREKQKNYIAKCIFLGKATEADDYFVSLWPDVEED